MSPFPAEPLNTVSSGSMSGKWVAPVQPTPEPDTGGEVDSADWLARTLAHAGGDWWITAEKGKWRNQAAAFLNSDWLADRLGEARAEVEQEWRDVAFDVIEKIREARENGAADERERIAAAIEASAKSNPDCRCCRDAARIARTAPLQDAEEVGE